LGPVGGFELAGASLALLSSILLSVAAEAAVAVVADVDVGGEAGDSGRVQDVAPEAGWW